MFRKLDKQRRILIGADFLSFSGLKPGEAILYKKDNFVAMRPTDDVDDSLEFLGYAKIDCKYRMVLTGDVCEYVFGTRTPELINVIAKKGEILFSIGT